VRGGDATAPRTYVLPENGISARNMLLPPLRLFPLSSHLQVMPRIDGSSRWHGLPKAAGKKGSPKRNAKEDHRFIPRSQLYIGMPIPSLEKAFQVDC
jgi:hypothetical protein